MASEIMQILGETPGKGMLKVLQTVFVCFKYRESDEVGVTTHTRPTAVSTT